jgi:hypothetical protein
LQHLRFFCACGFGKKLFNLLKDLHKVFLHISLPYIAYLKVRPTVGFSGSGGAGKTPSPKNYCAGSRRIP